MFFWTLCFVLTVLTPAAVLPVPIPTDRSTRVVNGEAVDISQVPYQASLRTSRNGAWTHLCGAAIISPRVALTAAHCVEGNTNPRIWNLVVGTSFRDLGGQSHEVSHVIIHPEYSDLVNDIAILGVSKAFRYSSTIAAIPMAPNGLDLPEGTPALVSGYGALYSSGPSSDVLMAAQVYVVSHSSCAESYRSLYTVATSMLCAAASNPARDACQGDSGGPLVSNGTLIGVVSWGEGCAEEEYPGVYTSVSVYSTWIAEHLVVLA